MRLARVCRPQSSGNYTLSHYHLVPPKTVDSKSGRFLSVNLKLFLKLYRHKGPRTKGAAALYYSREMFERNLAHARTEHFGDGAVAFVVKQSQSRSASIIKYADSRPHAENDTEGDHIAPAKVLKLPLPLRLATHPWFQKCEEWIGACGKAIADLNLVQDLSRNIGSPEWFKGLASFTALSLTAFMITPGFSAVKASPAAKLDTVARDEFRSQMILPLAFGGDTGRHMGASPMVRKLAYAPERPSINIIATLSQGDSFARMLERAGLNDRDRQTALNLIANTLPISAIKPGTKVDIELGRRENPGSPRVLKALSMRARLDLNLAITRHNDALHLEKIPVAINAEPLRIRGTIGESLYRSARMAGAPASAVQQYLRILSQHVDLDSALASGDVFDLIVDHRLAPSGESETGAILYAGIERGGKPVTQLMRWGKNNQFFEASGVGKTQTGLVRPVNGAMSSRFGMRMHPVLGYRRMHAGLDFQASYGSPILAVADGVVNSSGRMGGCGNAVRLAHDRNMQTRYCHMSRIAVGAGQKVRRGQIIGYVGSTGLSTGAHLHYEVYSHGQAIDPQSVKFVTRAQLSGRDLAEFRAELATLRKITPGSKSAPKIQSQTVLAQNTSLREIDKITAKQKLGV